MLPIDTTVMKIKLFLSSIALALTPGIAGADIHTKNVAKLDFKRIVRTVNSERGVVCFSAQGSSSGGGPSVSCVSRANVVQTAPLVVGEIDFKQVKEIFDDHYNVFCTVAQGSSSGGGVSISCL